MSLKYGILGLLSYGDMAGYDINKYFKESLAFFWNAQQSQIYRELGLLEKDAWVESELVVQNGKPNKKLYKINEKGLKELLDWLGDERLDELLVSRSQLLMKLFFSAKLPTERVVEFLVRYKNQCEATARRIAAHTSDLSEYQAHVEDAGESLFWKMTALYGVGHYQYNARWAQECIDMLKAGGE